MKIGVIQASSQKEKNSIIFESVTKTAKTLGHEVVNFGVFDDSLQQFSYIEIAICVSLLLSSRAVDFIVTGCSSGQGMCWRVIAYPVYYAATFPLRKTHFYSEELTTAMLYRCHWDLTGDGLEK